MPGERGMRTCHCIRGEEGKDMSLCHGKRDEDMSQCQGRGMRTCHYVRGEG